MRLISDEQFHQKSSLNLAPMVDFLFLIMAVFATIAVSRAVLHRKEIQLASSKQGSSTSKSASLNLSIHADGSLSFMKAGAPHLSLEEIGGLIHEQKKEKGLERLTLFLYIDKLAKWEDIAQLMAFLKESGCEIYPVYQSG